MFKSLSRNTGRPDVRRSLLAVAALMLLAVGLAPLLLSETVRAEDGEQNKAWKNLTMIYTTDIKGKIEPCG